MLISNGIFMRILLLSLLFYYFWSNRCKMLTPSFYILYKHVFSLLKNFLLYSQNFLQSRICVLKWLLKIISTAVLICLDVSHKSGNKCNCYCNRYNIQSWTRPSLFCMYMYACKYVCVLWESISISRCRFTYFLFHTNLSDLL